MAATSSRDRLLRTLLLAAGPAIGLFGYACDDGPSTGEVGRDALSTAGAAGAGARTGAGGIAGAQGGLGGGSAGASSFPPLPEAKGGSGGGYPRCEQFAMAGGSDGLCCVDMYCVPFVKGSCPAADDVERGVGTGSCACDKTTGPYDPGDRKPSGDSKGKDCCYLAGIFGCTGRPLPIAGALRVARLVAANGWS